MASMDEIMQDSAFIGATRDKKRQYLEYAFPDFKNKFPAEQDKYLDYIESKVHGTIKPPPTTLEKAGKFAGEVAETGTELAGMGGGAAIGTAIQPGLGTVLGGGTGYAAARTGIRGMKELLGIQPEMPLEEKAKEFAWNVPTGAAVEATAGIGNKIISKIFKPWQVTNTEKLAMDIAKREGIQLLPPEVTGERSQGIVFSTLNKLLGAVKPLQKFSTDQVKKYADWGETLFSDLGMMKKGEAGRMFKDAWTRARDVFDQHTEYLKKFYHSLTPNEPVVTWKTNDWWDKFKKTPEWEALTKSERKELNMWITKVQKADNFISLDEIGSAIGKKFESGQIGDKTEGIYKQIYRHVKTDMRDFAQSKGGSFNDAYNQYLTHYSENIDKFKGDIGRFVFDKDFNPEFLFKQINGNIQKLQQVKEGLSSLSADEFQIIRKMHLENLFEKSTSEINTNQGRMKIIDPNKLKTQMEKYSDDYLNVLLDSQQKSRLNEFLFIGKRMPMAIEFSRGEAKGVTAALMAGSLLGGTGIGVGAGFATGDIGTAVTAGTLGAGTVLLMPKLITKFVTSPTGLKWMTTGIELNPTAVKMTTRAGGLAIKDYFIPSEAQMPDIR